MFAFAIRLRPRMLAHARIEVSALRPGPTIRVGDDRAWTTLRQPSDVPLIHFAVLRKNAEKPPGWTACLRNHLAQRGALNTMLVGVLGHKRKHTCEVTDPLAKIWFIRSWWIGRPSWRSIGNGWHLQDSARALAQSTGIRPDYLRKARKEEACVLKHTEMSL